MRFLKLFVGRRAVNFALVVVASIRFVGAFIVGWAIVVVVLSSMWIKDFGRLWSALGDNHSVVDCFNDTNIH
jgi:hypothetical protein